MIPAEDQPPSQQNLKKTSRVVLPLDISTGEVWAPDARTSVQNRFLNVFVGVDGAVYSLPVKKNLKKVTDFTPPNSSNVALGRIFTIKKFATGTTKRKITRSGQETQFFGSEDFSRFVYVSNFSYGCLNLTYDRNLFDDSKLDTLSLRSFEEPCFKYLENSTLSPQDLIKIPIEHESINIAVDERHDKAVFPAYYMFQKFTDDTGSDPISEFHKQCFGAFCPRNIIAASLNGDPSLNPQPDGTNPRIGSLYYKNPEHDTDPTKPEFLYMHKNDFCHGCVNVGPYMVYFSSRFNEVRNSDAIDFQSLMLNPNYKSGDPNHPLPINVMILPYQVHDVQFHNNYLLVLKPDGILRFSLNRGDTENLFLEDPMFFIRDLVRFKSSVNAVGTEMIFFNEEGFVKTLRVEKDASVALKNLLPTSLPSPKGLERYANINFPKASGVFSIFDMDFMFIGPWLINLSTPSQVPSVTSYVLNTFEGHKAKYPTTQYIQDLTEDPGVHLFSSGEGKIVCDHSSIGKFLSYEETITEMTYKTDQITQQTAIRGTDLPLSFDEGDFSYGKVKNITTKPYIADSPFRISRLLVNFRADLLEALGAKTEDGTEIFKDYEFKLYLKVITHQEFDDFDLKKKETWVNLVTDSTGRRVPVSHYIIDLKQFSGNRYGAKKPEVVFDVGLSDVNFLSFSLTWEGSYPVVVEKMAIEVIKEV